MARNDRVLRGIRTPMKSMTVVARLSPGEGPAEMIDVTELLGFVGLDVLFTDTGTIDFTYDSATNKYTADYIGELSDNSNIVITAPADGEVLTYELSSDTWINAASASGVSDFLSLTDTPANYTGSAGKVAQVNGGETALEFNALTSDFSGQVVFAWAAEMTTSTSGSAYASKGSLVTFFESVTLTDVYARISATSGHTYRAEIYDLNGSAVIQTQVAVSASIVAAATAPTVLTFPISATLAAGTRYYIAITRTDGADTFVLPIYGTAPSGTDVAAFSGFPLEPYAETTMSTYGRVAKAAPAPGDTVGFGVNGFSVGLRGYPTLSAPLASLNLIGDVNAGSPTDNDVLQWDSGTSKWVNFDIFGTANTWSGVNGFDDDFDVDGDLIFADVSSRQVSIGRAIIGTRGLSVAKNMETRRDGGGGAMINVGFSDAANQPSLFSMEKARGSEATPTALLSGDDVGAIRIRGYDGAGFDNDGNFLVAETAENWGASAHGFRLLFSVTATGATSVTQRMYLESDGGLVVGSPTGASVGAGTINAQAVYDDNVLLTCYPLEAYIDGAVDVGAWDARVANRQHKRTIKNISVPLSDGSMVTEEVTDEPEWEEVRTHEPAAKFASRAERDLDPDLFYEDMVSRSALPAMPTKEEWAIDGPLSVGDTVQRLWETIEVIAIHGRKRDLALKEALNRIEKLENKSGNR